MQGGKAIRTDDLALPYAATSSTLPSELAVPEANGNGEPNFLTQREYAEPAHLYRSPFVRDAARVLHSKAFRRLAGKTQVFTRRDLENDHSRSRLTHTLEVAQIARTVTTALGLNSALAETLALVHDIGHPPFGHAGEQALDRALRTYGLGFDHNLHALRIVTSFEERYAAFPGLNLTLAVREGIVKHSRDYSADEHPELAEYFLAQRPPLEAQIIDVADEIAYLTADIEDGLAAGLLDLAQLRDGLSDFNGFYADTERTYPAAPGDLLIQESLRQMLDSLVTDLIQEVSKQVEMLGIHTLEDLRQTPRRIAHFSANVEAQRKKTKAFLYGNLYLSPQLEREHEHAEEVIGSLFQLWTTDPDLLPPDHQARAIREGTARAVADYIAGMTDSYIDQAWNSIQKA